MVAEVEAMRTCWSLLAIAVLVLGCSDDPAQGTDTAAGPDTWTAGDMPRTARQDTATDTAADTAGDAVGDAAPDASADTAAETIADAVVDAVVDVAPLPDAPLPDAPLPDAPLPDAPLPDAPLPDAPLPDAPLPDLPPPPPDVPPPDLPPPPACKDGEKARCWIECPIAYLPGCIDGGLNPKIMGLRTCAAGQWSKCQANTQCSALGPGPCQSGVNLDVTYPCLDGSQKAGKYICTKALGANCGEAWYINWPISDCPHFCAQSEAACDTAGAEKSCEILCGGGDGLAIPGKQKCQDGGCGFKYWSQCFGNKACPMPKPPK
jgi:hypothetical protein